MGFDLQLLLFLLLPVAAFSGWMIGHSGRSARRQSDCPDFSADYYRGLNYLLNEQQDKAIEVFVKMVEVDSETVETHFALGNLFRRRGEADRAIRIHQNLIARPTLSRDYREQALYELGLDYMRAGLLDRAENLFAEQINGSAYGTRALRQLVDIYQQEKDWHKAIHAAQRLADGSEDRLAPVISQFHCEVAEQQIEAGDLAGAVKSIRQALAEDEGCVRASLLEARIEMAQGSPRAATRALKRIEQQDPDYLPEALEPLERAFTQLHRKIEFFEYLGELIEKHGGISVMLAYAQLLAGERGDEEAIRFITESLRQRPSVRGMERLIELKLTRADSAARADLEVLRELTDRLLEGKPIYKCSHCGFTGKTLHWQCPTCRRWNTVKPIHGVEGE